jgi:caspase domain-containing protein/uncharacterized protein DUF4384
VPNRSVVVAALMIAVLGLGGTSVSAQTSWAVVVGVNDYAAYEGVEGGDLRGAVHDALSMRGVLQSRFNVPPENILTLLDRDATKDAIRDGLTGWLPTRVTPEDRVIFFFAGHGAQMGDVDWDETDYLDETISPADALATRADNDINDDELRSWLSESAAAQIVVILDSCHSGTGTRAFGEYVQPRSRIAWMRHGEALDRSGTPRSDGQPEGGSGIQNDLDDRIIEFAAAASGESAMDLSFRNDQGEHQFYGGAFTTHFVREIEAAGDDITFGDLYRRTLTAMRISRLEQTPQFRGPVEGTAFALPEGPTALAPSDGVSVESAVIVPTVVNIAVGRVQIELQADHGLSPEDVLADDLGALIRIEEVSIARAQGVVFLGETRVGATLSRADVELPDRVLRVHLGSVPEGDRAAYRVLLAKADRVELVSNPELGADIYLLPEDGVIRVLGRDGSVRAAMALGADGTPGPTLLTHVVRESVLQQVSLLSHSSPEFSVTLETASTSADFAVGEPVRFSVESGRDGYLTLIDLSPDGSLTVLFPNAWSGAGRVRAGERIVIPSQDGPFEIRATEPLGRGFVRALVTENPLDLPLDESGFASGGPGALSRSLRQALIEVGSSTRGLKVFRKEGQVLSGSWATAILSYVVR